jgi:hypothetical protein
MPLTQIGHPPGSQAEKDWHTTLSNALAYVRGQVCSTCGLGAFGHGPETRWLGNPEHKFVGVRATKEELQRAEDLTREAYRRRHRAIPQVRRVRCDGVVRARHYQPFANCDDVEYLLRIERLRVSSMSGSRANWEWRVVAQMVAT